MAKKQRKQRKQKEKQRPLQDHKKVGSKFITPINQLPGGMREISWKNIILPELIWMGVLIDKYGIARGIKLSISLAQMTHDIFTKAVGTAPNFTLTTSYASLTDNQKKTILTKFEEEGILNEIQEGLNELLFLYPESPLIFLKSTKIEINPLSALANFKSTLEKYFIRSGQPAMLIQANVAYFGIITKKIVICSPVTPPNLDILITDFNSEEGRKEATKLRALVIGLFDIPRNLKSDEWARYFWNNGIELENCTFHEENNDAER